MIFCIELKKCFKFRHKMFFMSSCINWLNITMCQAYVKSNVMLTMPFKSNIAIKSHSS